MMLLTVLTFSTLFALVSSYACDNQCSGHGKLPKSTDDYVCRGIIFDLSVGTCLEHGVCECYDNWGMGLTHLSGDCSERICPYEFAWVDKPNVYGRYHYWKKYKFLVTLNLRNSSHLCGMCWTWYLQSRYWRL